MPSLSAGLRAFGVFHNGGCFAARVGKNLFGHLDSSVSVVAECLNFHRRAKGGAECEQAQ